MHPAPMTAKTPSASANRIRVAGFVTGMKITRVLDLCRIATNTGEWPRRVNAEVRGVRDRKTDRRSDGDST